MLTRPVGAIKHKILQTKMKHTTFKAFAALVAAVAVVLITPRACTQPERATRLLEQQGYTEIRITGWRPFMAGKDDEFSTGFEATAPNGERVTGAVTGGLLFKGATVRFD